MRIHGQIYIHRGRRTPLLVGLYKDGAEVQSLIEVYSCRSELPPTENAVPAVVEVTDSWPKLTLEHEGGFTLQTSPALSELAQSMTAEEFASLASKAGVDDCLTTFRRLLGQTLQGESSSDSRTPSPTPPSSGDEPTGTSSPFEEPSVTQRSTT